MAYTDHTWSVGETLTAANMNGLRDNFRLAGAHLIVRKTSDESDSTGTRQNDDQLLLALAANEIWQFRFNLLVVSAATTDFLVGLAFPSGTISALVYAANATTFQGNDISSATSPTTGVVVATASTVSNHVIVEGVMSNGGTPGNLNLQWSGNAAAACVVKTNSTLWAVKLA